MKTRTLGLYLAFLLTFLIPISKCAQSNEQDSVHRVILSLDSTLFNVGFNQCEIYIFESLLAQDFEFYHDKSGYSDRSKFISDLRIGLCADPSNYQSRRLLLEESTEIHLLYKEGALYGALQTGRHRFFERIGTLPESSASTTSFSHYWELINGTWQLKRSFSYDHQ
jgi:hypothetical protein